MTRSATRIRKRMVAYVREHQIKCGGVKNRDLAVAIAAHLGIELPPDKWGRYAAIGARLPTSAKLARVKPAASVARASRIAFYDTDEWRRVRYLALKMHGGACQCCGARASPGKPLHVDHVKPRSRFPELELDVNNLQVLCADCNLGKGAWDQTDWRLRPREEAS